MTSHCSSAKMPACPDSFLPVETHLCSAERGTLVMQEQIFLSTFASSSMKRRKLPNWFECCSGEQGSRWCIQTRNSEK